MFNENRKTALERAGLRELGITHVLNAAEGKFNNVLTGAGYYGDMGILYYGVEADDKPTFNISQYFCPATQFIHEALSHSQSESCRKPFNLHHSLEKKPPHFAFGYTVMSPYYFYLCSRQGAGALCDGSQQVGDSGPGIPDDEAQPDSSGCY